MDELDVKVSKGNMKLKRIFKNPFVKGALVVCVLIFGFLIGTGVTYEEPSCESIKSECTACPVAKECPKAVNVTNFVVPICEPTIGAIRNDTYVLGLINQVEYLEKLSNDCYFSNSTDREDELRVSWKECNATLKDIQELI